MEISIQHAIVHHSEHHSTAKMIPQNSRVDLYAIITEELDTKMENLSKGDISKQEVSKSKVVAALPASVRKQTSHNCKEETQNVKRKKTNVPLAYNCPKCKQGFMVKQELNDHVLEHLVAQVDVGVREQEERANAPPEVQERKVKRAKRKHSTMAKPIEFSSTWAKWLDRGEHHLCSPTNSWSHHSYLVQDQSTHIVHKGGKGTQPALTASLVPIPTWSPTSQPIIPPIYKHSTSYTVSRPSARRGRSLLDDDDDDKEDIEVIVNPTKRSKTGFNTEVTTAIDISKFIELDGINIDADLCEQIMEVWIDI